VNLQAEEALHRKLSNISTTRLPFSQVLIDGPTHWISTSFQSPLVAGLGGVEAILRGVGVEPNDAELVAATPFVVDAAGRAAAGGHFVLITVDPLSIAFRTGGRAELDARIAGFKELVLQLQNEVAELRSVHRNVLPGVSGTQVPTMQPSWTSYSADPPRLTQPVEILAVEQGDESFLDVRRRRRADRRLVIFTSDNGPERNTPGTAAPFRGTKHTVLEGGLRVPCIAWWPGMVPAARVCDEFLTTLDLLPTFARLAGSPLPESRKLDGYDLSPVLLGQKDMHSPRTTLYSLYGYNRNRGESFREKHWKLHLSTPPELYNLTSNIAETPNVAAQHPDVVKRLSESARQVREETHAISTTNPSAGAKPRP
jgi:hypothetical protein